MARPDLRDYLEIRTATPVNFSPDGSKVLVSSNLSGTSQLYVVPTAGGPLRQLTDLDEPVGGAYLPVGDQVVVTRDVGGNERTQLHLMADDGTGLRPLVEDLDHIHRLGGASRDGRWVAYASNARNGTDFDVYVHPLDDSGPSRMVCQLGGWCSAAGFSPDGRWLAVLRLTERNGDNDLYLIDVEGGEQLLVSAHDDEASFSGPSWLPDSSAFFFSSDTGRDRSAIARYDMATRTWQYVLEREWDADCSIDWLGQRLLVVTDPDGATEAELVDPVTLETTAQVRLPGRGVAGFGFSRDGRHLAYSYSSPIEPGDAWLYDCETGDTRRLTTSPRAVPAEAMVEPTVHRFASFDGEQIPAFLYRPADPAPPAEPAPPAPPSRVHDPRAARGMDSRTAGTATATAAAATATAEATAGAAAEGGGGGRPVVAYLHGGPESQFVPSFNPLVQYLVARGYVVVAPNVRGSTGYGKRYHHLDDVRKRLDAVADLAAMHEWLQREGGVDGARAALFGGSYGGYLVLAGLAFQPERWAAGVDIVGISSLVTFLENTSVWRRAFREREYGSLAHDRDFLTEVSPLTHVEQMRAPLFIIHGANDPRVPLGEAQQLHAVLSEKGVRAELAVYEDEGHGLAKLKNRLDAYPRAADFLDEVLGVT